MCEYIPDEAKYKDILYQPVFMRGELDLSSSSLEDGKCHEDVVDEEIPLTKEEKKAIYNKEYRKNNKEKKGNL